MVLAKVEAFEVARRSPFVDVVEVSNRSIGVAESVADRSVVKQGTLVVVVARCAVDVVAKAAFAAFE